jgi:hypothetical protein
MLVFFCLLLHHTENRFKISQNDKILLRFLSCFVKFYFKLLKLLHPSDMCFLHLYNAVFFKNINSLTFSLRTNFSYVSEYMTYTARLQRTNDADSDTESIEWFIENKAFSRSYDSAPPHPLLYPSPDSKLSLLLSLPMCRRSSLLTGERGGGLREEPNHMTSRKPGPL